MEIVHIANYMVPRIGVYTWQNLVGLMRWESERRGWLTTSSDACYVPAWRKLFLCCVLNVVHVMLYD